MKKLLLFALLIGCCAQAMEQQYPLHDAAQAGNLAAVINLLENHHYDPNVKDSNDCTPLHKAALWGHKNVAECLIKDPKCDPNLQDNYGRTALHIAALWGHKNIVECLINHPKCNPNLQDNYGETPLHIVAEQGHQNVAECLIKDPKCDPNLQDNYGRTALHKAALWGHQNVAECLINHPKCDPNLQDERGKTALHMAALYGKTAIAKALLYHGANLSIPDKSHNYPFEVAKTTELKKLLTPSDPDKFRENPDAYKKKHYLEFHPALQFPEEFMEFINKERHQKINGQNTVFYLLRRELGFPKNYSPRLRHNPSEQTVPELTKDLSKVNSQ